VWNITDFKFKHKFVVSDLNNDGFLEVIYADRILNLLNGSTVAFFNHSIYSTFDNTGQIDFGTYVGVGDFDEDGNGDILKVGMNYFSIWMNNGTMLANINIATNNKGNVVIRDIDNDGYLDFGCVLGM